MVSLFYRLLYVRHRQVALYFTVQASMARLTRCIIKLGQL